MSAARRATWSAGPSRGRWQPEAAREAVSGCRYCGGDAARSLRLADIEDRQQIARPEDAVDVLAPELADRDREHCVAALLDTKHRLISVTTVSVGSVDHTFMAPREIFRDALLANASAVVLGHNHPSGDPEPSRDDELVTRRIGEAGEVVGIDLLDHVVVAGSRWISLARRGVV